MIMSKPMNSFFTRLEMYKLLLVLGSFAKLPTFINCQTLPTNPLILMLSRITNQVSNKVWSGIVHGFY